MIRIFDIQNSDEPVPDEVCSNCGLLTTLYIELDRLVVPICADDLRELERKISDYFQKEE